MQYEYQNHQSKNITLTQDMNEKMFAVDFQSSNFFQTNKCRMERLIFMTFIAKLCCAAIQVQRLLWHTPFLTLKHAKCLEIVLKTKLRGGFTHKVVQIKCGWF